ncbi:hypothetical protein P3T76_015253 [Phytophthora citrophthora]|uniref:Uncharacterized protein n=1 Tax=Phytophthora citrophthora TaxID=4793 RepID=A0AAD9LAI7_9STRA|nr:hypothetical protein P3T76_015253 [Phytophthora citrophthora]
MNSGMSIRSYAATTMARTYHTGYEQAVQNEIEETEGATDMMLFPIFVRHVDITLRCDWLYYVL